MPIALLLAPVVQDVNNGPDLTRYALVCFGLLLGILGVAYLFKRFLADSLRRKASRRSLHVVDVLPLGGKQKLVVVSCYDRNFLLGLGEKEVNSIAELDVEDVDDPGRSSRPGPPAAVRSAEPDELEPPFRARFESAVREEESISEPVPRRTAPWDDSQGVLA